MPSAIRIGSHVSGLIGPFLPLSEGQQRMKCQHFFGIVIRSIQINAGQSIGQTFIVALTTLLIH